MPIHAPNILGSGPLNVIGHHPLPEPRLHADFGGATWARAEGIKKGEERNSQWHTSCDTITRNVVVISIHKAHVRHQTYDKLK